MFDDLLNDNNEICLLLDYVIAYLAVCVLYLIIVIYLLTVYEDDLIFR
jgi:hypothetical protein